MSCRVEALIGRGDIKTAALGSQHTLFLDSKGAVFSCGENKEGQCGYGTSIAVLAKQRREEWDIGANIGRIATNLSSNSVGMDGHGNSSEHHASQKSQHSAWFSGQALKPFIERGARQAEVEEANRLASMVQSVLTVFWVDMTAILCRHVCVLADTVLASDGV